MLFDALDMLATYPATPDKNDKKQIAKGGAVQQMADEAKAIRDLFERWQTLSSAPAEPRR